MINLAKEYGVEVEKEIEKNKKENEITDDEETKVN